MEKSSPSTPQRDSAGDAPSSPATSTTTSTTTNSNSRRTCSQSNLNKDAPTFEPTTAAAAMPPHNRRTKRRPSGSGSGGGGGSGRGGSGGGRGRRHSRRGGSNNSPAGRGGRALRVGLYTPPPQRADGDGTSSPNWEHSGSPAPPQEQQEHPADSAPAKQRQGHSGSSAPRQQQQQGRSGNSTPTQQQQQQQGRSGSSVRQQQHQEHSRPPSDRAWAPKSHTAHVRGRGRGRGVHRFGGRGRGRGGGSAPASGAPEGYTASESGSIAANFIPAPASSSRSVFDAPSMAGGDVHDPHVAPSHATCGQGMSAPHQSQAQFMLPPQMQSVLPPHGQGALHESGASTYPHSYAHMAQLPAHMQQQIYQNRVHTGSVPPSRPSPGTNYGPTSADTQSQSAYAAHAEAMRRMSQPHVADSSHGVEHTASHANGTESFNSMQAQFDARLSCSTRGFDRNHIAEHDRRETHFHAQNQPRGDADATALLERANSATGGPLPHHLGADAASLLERADAVAGRSLPHRTDADVASLLQRSAMLDSHRRVSREDAASHNAREPPRRGDSCSGPPRRGESGSGPPRRGDSGSGPPAAAAGGGHHALQLQDARGRVASLEEENRRLRRKLAAAEKEIEENDASTEKLEESLRQSYETTKTTLLKKLVDRHKVELNKLQGQLDRKEIEIRHLREKANPNSTEIETLKRARDQALTQVRQLNAKLELSKITVAGRDGKPSGVSLREYTDMRHLVNLKDDQINDLIHRVRDAERQTAEVIAKLNKRTKMLRKSELAVRQLKFELNGGIGKAPSPPPSKRRSPSPPLTSQRPRSRSPPLRPRRRSRSPRFKSRRRSSTKGAGRDSANLDDIAEMLKREKARKEKEKSAKRGGRRASLSRSPSPPAFASRGSRGRRSSPKFGSSRKSPSSRGRKSRRGSFKLESRSPTPRTKRKETDKTKREASTANENTTPGETNARKTPAGNPTPLPKRSRSPQHSSTKKSRVDSDASPVRGPTPTKKPDDDASSRSSRKARPRGRHGRDRYLSSPSRSPPPRSRRRRGSFKLDSRSRSRSPRSKRKPPPRNIDRKYISDSDSESDEQRQARLRRQRRSRRRSFSSSSSRSPVRGRRSRSPSEAKSSATTGGGAAAPNRRVRPTTPSAVFDLPTGHAIAMLIGRQGARIEELRAKTECVIWIEQKKEMEHGARTQRVEVAGPPEGVELARATIVGLGGTEVPADQAKRREPEDAKSNAPAGTAAGGGAGDEDAGAAAERLARLRRQPREPNATVELHVSMVGRLLGERGVLIDKLRSRTDCQIWLPSANARLPKSQMVKVEIQGSEEGVAEARKVIEELERLREPRTWTPNRILVVPSASMSAVIGSMHRTLNEIKKASGCHIEKLNPHAAAKMMGFLGIYSRAEPRRRGAPAEREAQNVREPNPAFAERRIRDVVATLREGNYTLKSVTRLIAVPEEVADVVDPHYVKKLRKKLRKGPGNTDLKMGIVNFDDLPKLPMGCNQCEFYLRVDNASQEVAEEIDAKIEKLLKKTLERESKATRDNEQRRAERVVPARSPSTDVGDLGDVQTEDAAPVFPRGGRRAASPRQNPESAPESMMSSGKSSPFDTPTKGPSWAEESQDPQSVD